MRITKGIIILLINSPWKSQQSSCSSFISCQKTFLFRLISSSKENIPKPTVPKLRSPKKKTPLEIDDDDDDFISTTKRLKVTIQPVPMKVDPIKECLEGIISKIEQNDATCPICNQILINLPAIDQREEHVNRCLEESQMNNVNFSSFW